MLGWTKTAQEETKNVKIQKASMREKIGVCEGILEDWNADAKQEQKMEKVHVLGSIVTKVVNEKKD